MRKKAYKFDEKQIKLEILRHARAIGIPEGEAKDIAKKITQKTKKWLENKHIVTQNELDNKISDELEILSKDLSFIYKNQGGII